MKVNAKVLAVRRLDFVTEKNEEIKGYQVWLCAPTSERAWNGHEVMKSWVPDNDSHAPDAAALLHDDTVVVEFNRYGKPVITEFAPVLV